LIFDIVANNLFKLLPKSFSLSNREKELEAIKSQNQEMQKQIKALQAIEEQVKAVMEDNPSTQNKHKKIVNYCSFKYLIGYMQKKIKGMREKYEYYNFYYWSTGIY